MLIRAAFLCVLMVATGPAADLETDVIFEGADHSRWDTARDAARLEREFSLTELAPAPDANAIRWRFISKGVSFNDIFLRTPIRRPFSLIRFRLKNLGAPVTVASKVRDASGAEWSANRVRLAENQNWTWVEFPRDQWRVAPWSKDADGRLDFPLSYIVLIAFDVKPDREVLMQLSRVEIVRPKPPIAELHKLQMPQTFKAGERAQASLSFTLNRSCERNEASLVFIQDGAERFKVEIPLSPQLSQIKPGREISVARMDFRVPLYAQGGTYSVALRLGEARVRYRGGSADKEVMTVSVEPRVPGRTAASVKMYRGAPTLFVNGEPISGMAYTAYGPSVRVFSDFAKAGVRLFSFSATPTEAGYGLSRTTWKSPDQYDYSQLDERVMMALEANPDAYVFPRLYLHAPKWWSQLHPDDIVRMDPGDGKPTPFIHAGGLPAPSWASEKWRSDSIEGLRRLIEHVEASPYADRVIGYHLASGTTEEWMMWGANEGQWVDYSPVNVKRFREWLKEKYGTDEALRNAWRDPKTSLANASIPTRKQRQQTKLGSLRRPDKEQAVIDFYLYNSELVADTIATLAKVVKDMTKREKVVGVFYGYLLQLCGEQRQQNAGHLALEEVLGSPDIDFLCSPTSYAFRQVGGEGTSHFMSLLGSVKLHGKLWFDENDIRTSLAPGKIGMWGKAENVAGDILQQDKELANVLVNGAAQWWFDVGRNRYDDPALMKRISELTADASEALQIDRTPVDEIALVVDEKSLCYLKVGDPLGRELLLSQLPALHRVGAPVGHYLTTDLPQLRRHKLLLLTTSFAPDARQRQALNELKSDGRVLVFCWIPGLYRNGQLDPDATADFCGIRLKLTDEPVDLRVRLSGDDELTRGLDGVEYGPKRPIFPACVAADPDAIVLGALPDGRPGLVVKRYSNWTAIHSAAPMLPAELLRRIARFAGVHIYVDTPDVVWACKDLLAVSVNEPGRRDIRLPRIANVRDLYKGKGVAEQTDRFIVEFPEKATRVFILGK